MMLSDVDRRHLRRSVDLAAEALRTGNKPFGSVLVSGSGAVLFEDHNRVADGDPTRHPELALALWAVANIAPEERAAATVYTSGEHCPMCAGAHGWAGLGRIVYASSAQQLGQWLAGLDVPPSPVRALPIGEVIEGARTTGPVAEFADEIRQLHLDYYSSPHSAG